MHQFPADFLWGVATAGHQNEGDNVASDTWFLENVSPTIFKERSGKACNTWELWREDLDLVAAMDLNAFRFSTEWARIEPVDGEFDAAALDHYEAVVDECLERGLAPAVTFNHFTSPHWFAARGAWLDQEAPELFARFCDRVMAAFGDRIAIGVTLNEPNLPAMLTWAGLPRVRRDRAGDAASCTEATGVERYRASNVMLPRRPAPCARAWRRGIVRRAQRSRRVDPTFRLGCRSPSPTTSSTARIHLRDRKRAEVYESWLEIAADDDFIGVQNYERHTTTRRVQ